MVDAATVGWQMQAQERLMFINDVAAGTGNMKKGAHRSHFRLLRRQARGRIRPSSETEITRSRAPAATPDALRAIGVDVVMVEGAPS